MRVLELYADEHGETHFREVPIDMSERNFAPPSLPIRVSSETRVSTSVMLAAPPGWDPAFHPTPRKQFAVLLSGRAVATVSDGETRDLGPGGFVILNDAGSKGHRTVVQGGEDAVFFLVAMDEG